MAYNTSVRLEWDPTKDEANRKKHGLSFHEAKELFTSSTDFLEIYDDEHSEEEDRFIAIGPIRAGIIVVIYTEPQDEIIRIVSARKATKKEVLLFHKHYGEHQ
jgi:uncharacterized DUF497 family protein